MGLVVYTPEICCAKPDATSVWLYYFQSCSHLQFSYNWCSMLFICCHSTLSVHFDHVTCMFYLHTCRDLQSPDYFTEYHITKYHTLQTTDIFICATIYFIYGHTKQKALHPVRSAKLSCLGPRQYYGGGPHGNPRCRRFWFLFAKISVNIRGLGDWYFCRFC